MSTHNSRVSSREEKALIIVIVGITAGLLYPILSKEIGDPYALFNGLIIGFLGSAYIAATKIAKVNTPGPFAYQVSGGDRSDQIGVDVQAYNLQHELNQDPSAGQVVARDSSPAAASKRSTVSIGGPKVPGKASPELPKQW